MIITKMLIDTNGILIGCECYSEKVESITKYKGKEYKSNEGGFKEIREEIKVYPKDIYILSIDDLFHNEVKGLILYTKNGESLTMKEYMDTTNIGEEIKRYTLAYTNGKELLSMQRVRAVDRDIISTENMSAKDLNYLINSYTRRDRIPLEVL